MDESKPNQSPDNGVKALNVSERGKEDTETHGLRDDFDVNTPIGDVKGPNVFERVKEEFEAIAESIQSRRDKNQDSPSSAERGDTTILMPGSPSKFKLKNLRVKSEPQKSPTHHKETHGRGKEIDPDTPISEFKGPSIFHRAKEEIEAIVDTINTKKESSPRKEGGFRATLGKLKSPVAHHKETHGRGEDIDPDTPISEFRGPSIFHRAKEEFEAIVDSIQQKKDSESPKKEGGSFRASISKKLQRAYSGKDRSRE